MAEVLDSMSRNPATVCAVVMTAQGNVKIYRTAIPNGAVRCTENGMEVMSAPPPKFD